MPLIKRQKLVDELKSWIDTEAIAESVIARIEDTPLPKDVDALDVAIELWLSQITILVEEISRRDVKKVIENVQAMHNWADDIKETLGTLKIGDRVEYKTENLKGRGTVVFYRGNIRIKLDEKAGGRRYIFLGNGWEKYEK